VILSVPFSFSSEAFSVKKREREKGEKIFSQERRGGGGKKERRKKAAKTEENPPLINNAEHLVEVGST
jgi:hypothetical protein